MASIPAEQELKDALASAGQAHHDYEANFLGGVRDEHWAGWYAAYVLGRLGDFTTPTMLTQKLGTVSAEGDWAENAAAVVRAAIGAG